MVPPPTSLISEGREYDRLVLIREDELEALRSQSASPLDALRNQFDEMMARMQTPEARKAAAGIRSASSRELGEAALKGFRRSD